MSLNRYPVSAVLPIGESTMEEMTDFYVDEVGLLKVVNRDGVVFSAGNGTQLHLYQSPAGVGPSGATAATFEVSDVVAEVAELREAGVVFEEYDDPSFQTVDGVYTDGDMKAAWFVDPAGNVICIHQA
jgi:catechol 2,3-dioxygenase-like lactoylglutathione lyase family enzyme